MTIGQGIAVAAITAQQAIDWGMAAVLWLGAVFFAVGIVMLVRDK